MGGDFWRGLGSGLQQVPGRVENVAGLGLDALTTLNAAASHDPTALLRLQLLQSQAAQDPGVRSQLGSGGAPFFSGLLGYPVHSQPQAGPVQPGQGPLPTVLAPRLPPLSPATQADRALQGAETELIQANPQAAARAEGTAGAEEPRGRCRADAGGDPERGAGASRGAGERRDARAACAEERPEAAAHRRACAAERAAGRRPCGAQRAGRACARRSERTPRRRGA